jgi:hypothetical protein
MFMVQDGRPGWARARARNYSIRRLEDLRRSRGQSFLIPPFSTHSKIRERFEHLSKVSPHCSGDSARNAHIKPNLPTKRNVCPQELHMVRRHTPSRRHFDSLRSAHRRGSRPWQTTRCALIARSLPSNQRRGLLLDATYSRRPRIGVRAREVPLITALVRETPEICLPSRPGAAATLRIVASLNKAATFKENDAVGSHFAKIVTPRICERSRLIHCCPMYPSGTFPKIGYPFGPRESVTLPTAL